MPAPDKLIIQATRIDLLPDDIADSGGVFTTWTRFQSIS
jgi:hypothetical protein